MAISDETRQALYHLAHGQCQCTMRVCGHHRAGTRCLRSLASGYWQAHHLSRTGGDTLNNLTAMCATCHKNTRTYGRPK